MRRRPPSLPSPRSSLVAAALLCTVVLLSACGGFTQTSASEAQTSAAAGTAGPAGSGFPVTVTDAAGTALTVDKPVTRIACYWYGCNAMLAELGLLPVVTWKDESLRSPIFLGAGYDRVATTEDWKDPEEIGGSRPELIIGRTPTSKDFDALSVAGRTFYMDGGFDKGIEVYERNLRWLGQLTGRSDRADQAIKRFQSVLAAVKAKLPQDAPDTSLAVLSGYEPSKYAVFFDNVIFCQLIEKHGMGDCVLTPPAGLKVEDAYGEISGEYLLKADPDLIANQSDGTGATSVRARKDAVWSKIRAVREGRAYDTDAQYYCCSLRELQYTLEDYVHRAFPDAGYRDPGPARTYDPDAAVATTG